MTDKLNNTTLEDLKTCYRVITGLIEDKDTRAGEIQALRTVQNRLANSITKAVL